MKHSQYTRRTFLMLVVVGLIPATIVSAAWCIAALFMGHSHGHLLAIAVLTFGLLVAIGLALFFARRLTQPIHKLHNAATELAGGMYHELHEKFGHDEYGEIFASLQHAAARLDQTLSEDQGQMAVLESERNKLRSVLNSMTDGVFALDRDGRIILFNHAAVQLTGRSIDQVAGQLAEKVVPLRRNGELVMARWLDSQLGTDHKRGEWKGLELYRADGSSLYVDVQATTINDDPNGIRALVTFHDLTEEHKLEEMKIDFVALAAHELRTPITEIRGYLDIMQHEPIGLRQAGKELVDRTMMSVAQLSGLVNNLLGVARIEHGEMNYHPEMVDWNDFLKSLEPNLKMQIEGSKRKLSYKLGTKLPEVAVDTVAMQEVINNLITNAIAHTDSGKGQISISTGLKDGEIETVVTDNGTGIPADAIKHLFTKFYRYEGGMHTTRGTGLGLYITKSIVTSHGGYIWVESEVGKGTSFFFRLPTKTRLAGQRSPRNTTTITKGAHGWIKDHTLR